MGLMVGIHGSFRVQIYRAGDLVYKAASVIMSEKV